MDRRSLRTLWWLLVVGVCLLAGVIRADAAPRIAVPAQTAPGPTTATLSAGDAIVLGLVEGITEYLPVSSTGHLVVTERLLKIVPKEGLEAHAKEALDSYTVIIQLGAILAVLVLFRKRVWTVIQGLIGKSAEGRRLLIALVIAFIPAAVFGKAFESAITDHLLRPLPVAEAWLVGGAVIFAFVRWGPRTGRTLRAPEAAAVVSAAGDALPPVIGQDAVRNIPLELITVRQAVVIGAAQVLSLIPGTSRSLVTILAALLVGLSLSAAVEFSFLLGLLTLSAATGYELLSKGGTVHDVYGFSTPLIGVLVAAVAAVAAVKWMVGYLNRHDLALFGYYRILIGIVTIVLLATEVIGRK